MSDTSFAFLQSRCFNVPDALYAPSEDIAQTVTHHMCTFNVMGFCMDAAMIHSVTETGTGTGTGTGAGTGTETATNRIPVVRYQCVLHDCARFRSNTVRIWYATGRVAVARSTELMPRTDDRMSCTDEVKRLQRALRMDV